MSKLGDNRAYLPANIWFRVSQLLTRFEGFYFVVNGRVGAKRENEMV
jgi:hypothetical protein